MKSHSLFIGALAMASLAIPATASAQSGYGYTYNPPVQNVQCERQRKDDQFAGVLVGAIAGGLLPVVTWPIGLVAGAGFMLYKRLRP